MQRIGNVLSNNCYVECVFNCSMLNFSKRQVNNLGMCVKAFPHHWTVILFPLHNTNRIQIFLITCISQQVTLTKRWFWIASLFIGLKILLDEHHQLLCSGISKHFFLQKFHRLSLSLLFDFFSYQPRSNAHCHTLKLTTLSSQISHVNVNCCRPCMGRAIAHCQNISKTRKM